MTRWMGRLAVTAALVGLMAPAEAAAATGKAWVFVGTYTGGKAGSKGVYRFELDLATGKPGPVELAAELPSPSFLAIHPSGKFLYTANESGGAGIKGGAVSALALDPATGALTLLNQAPAGGAGPCHLVVDKAGKN